jgi:tetratricopeptide (TPR) repeat protein
MVVLCCFSFVQLVSMADIPDTDARIQELYNGARADEQQTQLDAAIQKYRAILELDPRLAPAYNNLGRLYFKQARYRDAIEVLKRALALDPKLASSRTLLGVSLYEINDFRDAQQELSEALRLNPNDRNAKLYLARSLLELEDLKRAARILEDLEHDKPQDAQILYALGQVYMRLAASTLENLQRADPNSYLIEVLLGKTAEAKQALAEAIEHYKKAVAKAPDAKSLHYLLGHALYQNGESSDALREFRRELEINPYDHMASWQAGLIRLSDNPQEAFRLANQALELKPDLAPALMVRGRALLALKRPADAVKDFKRAALLEPDEDTVHFQLARAYRELGLTREAQAEDAIFAQIEKAAHTPKETGTAPSPP